MVRTVVSIEEDLKKWLDRKAAEEGVPMTELIRRAVRLLRQQLEAHEPPTEELLESTRGLWRQGDGLAYQRRLRDEW